ncbi:MAG: hypothetical protein RMJ36_00960 [Candidatus Calescibacterium sp.]|nr:hypothetical protein [Candidatus Calescibacterium sp.]MDW8132210.1 hypothetical protein [Candidatus Calescibacterium sp.]
MRRLLILFVLLFSLTISVGQELLKIKNMTLFYPSYYIKVELYNQYQTVVLLDSRNQNRSLYVELLRTDIKDYIKQNLLDLYSLYEGKYKVITNEVRNYKGRNLYVLEYTFVQLNEEYKTVKYFWEFESGSYLGLYCLSPFAEFSQIYSDFVNLFQSIKE